MKKFLLLPAPPKVFLLAPTCESSIFEDKQEGPVEETLEVANPELESALTAFSNQPTPIEEWEDWETHQLEVAFQCGRELVRKLAEDMDFTQRVEGQSVWDVRSLTKHALAMQHGRIPQAKLSYSKVGLTMLLDISGSCASEAEMFAAIAAGALSDGVKIYFGENGHAYRMPLRFSKVFTSYSQAKAWIEKEIERVTAGKEWQFGELVKAVSPQRLIIFGDWDGLSCNQYQQVTSRHKRQGWYWFCNETRFPIAGEAPAGWTPRNYFPQITTTQKLVSALKRVR